MSRYKEFEGWLPAAQWMLEKPGERWTRQLGGGCTWKGVNPHGEGGEMNNKGFAVLAVMGAAAISTAVSMAIFELYIWVKSPDEKIITVTEEQITPEKPICVGE